MLKKWYKNKGNSTLLIENEKKSCNIHKIIELYVKMLDKDSQINRFLLLNKGYNVCKCCMAEKYETFNRNAKE